MRKVALLAIVLAAVAALVPNGRVVASSATPTYVEGITFDAPVRMDYTDPAQVGGPGEPSIKVGPDGTIYTAGVCCVARAAPAWYSKDDGGTWRNLPSPAAARETSIGAEGDFVIDDAGGAYFADTYIPSMYFTRWSGRGDVWEYTIDTAMVVPGLDDRPWLAYQHGTVHMYVNHGTHVTLYRSRDGGQTWDITFNTLGQGQRYWPGMLVADRDSDDVYLYGRCTGQTLCMAASHDEGDTWSEVQIGNPPRGTIAPIFVSVGIDGSGTVYGTFADVNGSGCDVYVDVSTDKGQTFSRYKVSPQTGCSTFPWIAGGDDGRVALAWYHTDQTRHQDQVTASGEWRVQAAVVTGAASDDPIVTWGELDRVIHTGPLGRSLWDYQQIDVGPDGRFHIAFAENHEAPCAGSLSTHGGAVGYRNMCTTYVAQEGGPRALVHAADATSIDALDITASGDAIGVIGAATFGRVDPVRIVDSDQQTEFPPTVDIIDGTIARPSATSDELVLTLNIEELPEAIGSVATRYVWSLESSDGTASTVSAVPRPWSFEACSGGTCSRIRGDTNAGADRVVARVPIELLGASPGEELTIHAADARLQGSPPIDVAMAAGPYTIPAAEVSVTILDPSGVVVASESAELSGDLSAFSASLGGLDPGDYTVTVEACFAANCASASQVRTIG